LGYSEAQIDGFAQDRVVVCRSE
ncbi:MAG: hypothetical protein RL676_1129, partial [Pseudomonadota bacterium]